MAGTVVADQLEAASTSTLVLKNGVASTPPTVQDSGGVEIGTFCRAWANWNGTGTVAIRASFNVSSITDNGTGDYTVNFATAMPDANYGVSFASGPGNGRFPYISTASFNDTTNTAATLMSTTQLRVIMANSSANLNDTSFFCVAIFR